MTVKQGLVARAVAFTLGAVALVVLVEAAGRALVGLVAGEPDADGIWPGVRMAGWSVAFVVLMLGLGRLGAAVTYRDDPDVADDPEGPDPTDGPDGHDEPDVADDPSDRTRPAGAPTPG